MEIFSNLLLYQTLAAGIADVSCMVSTGEFYIPSIKDYFRPM
mgnify:CR=1 FL=1